MDRHLNLVESDFEELDKRTFPRFPFCFLTFKSLDESSDLTYEIKDISHTGMQVALRMGEHPLKEKENITGLIHWNGRELQISGKIKWKTQMRAGIEFNTSAQLREKIDDLLDLATFAKRLKPVHKMDYGVEIPAMLKYWLRSDGPVEVFVWKHADGEISKFEVLMMENFVEWEDIKGLKTARVISKRDKDTPLLTEDEFVFKIDADLDDEKISKAARLIAHLPEDLMDGNIVRFITLKLRS